jgi:hypothetical protein
LLFARHCGAYVSKRLAIDALCDIVFLGEAFYDFLAVLNRAALQPIRHAGVELARFPGKDVTKPPFIKRPPGGRSSETDGNAQGISQQLRKR